MKNLKKTLLVFAVVLCMAICFFAVEASAGSVDSINYNISNGQATIVNSPDVSDDVVIPDTVEENGTVYPVTAIGIDSLSMNGNITSVTIGKNVTSIGDSAFTGDGSLTVVNFSDSLVSIGYGAFSMTGLKSVTIPASVTIIDGMAFGMCADLTSITVDKNNTVFDSRDNCNAVMNSSTDELVAGCNNTTIPDDTKSIGFASMATTSFTDITIPDSVTNISGSAFGYCESLESVTIGKGVTNIGDGAFVGCEKIATVKCDCGKNFSEITISTDGNPEIITDTTKWTKIHNIGYYYNNDATCTADGTETVKCGCGEITGITTTAEGTKLGHSFTDYVYNNDATCTADGTKTAKCDRCDATDTVTDEGSATGVHIPAEAVKENVVEGTCLQNGSYDSVVYCSECKAELSRETVTVETKIVNYTISVGKATITKSPSAKGDIVIPATVTEDGVTYPVTTIGSTAFYDCTALKSVTIPDSVTSIDNLAFFFSSVTSVNIPDSVTRIGEDAFSGCDYLTSITIGKGVTSISNRAFEACEALESVTIPDSVTSIGNSAFGYCYALKDITIPESVTKIGNFAFTESGLESITIPDGVSVIGTEAFEGCMALRNVTIGKNVAGIGDEAFSGCKNLTSITVDENNSTFDSRDNCNAVVRTLANEIVVGCNNTVIPGSVTSIGVSSFSGTDITAITISDNVTFIGENAFSNCNSLTNINIPDSVSYIGENAFFSCTALSDVTIGNGLTSISAAAFVGTAVTDIIIPDSVTDIDTSAFYDCSALRSVIIGNGVESIGEGAFIGCTSLTSVAMGDAVASIESDAFSLCKALTTVTYSCGKNPADMTISSTRNPEIIIDTTKWTKVHILGDYVYNNDATCTADGTKTAKCACGEKTDVIAATGTAGHKAVAVPAVAATCTTDGSTEGSKCSACGEILVAPETVAALGHIDADGNNSCDRCGASMGNSDEGTTNCSHICHSSSKFLQFFWKIFNFFNKLFKANKTCTCGVAHY